MFLNPGQESSWIAKWDIANLVSSLVSGCFARFQKIGLNWIYLFILLFSVTPAKARLNFIFFPHITSGYSTINFSILLSLYWITCHCFYSLPFSLLLSLSSSYFFLVSSSDFSYLFPPLFVTPSSATTTTISTHLGLTASTPTNPCCLHHHYILPLLLEIRSLYQQPPASPPSTITPKWTIRKGS